MVQRLRLRPHVEEYVVQWSATASGEDRERVAEFVESLADGSWYIRWYPDPSLQEHQKFAQRHPRTYLPAPEWTVVWPDKGLVVLMQIKDQPDAAEQHVEAWVEEIRIVRVEGEVEDEFGLPLPPPDGV